jgi:hypothetical protein
MTRASVGVLVAGLLVGLATPAAADTAPPGSFKATDGTET